MQAERTVNAKVLGQVRAKYVLEPTENAALARLEYAGSKTEWGGDERQ